LAKDVLAVPASTVPSEYAFSTGGRIIDLLRCSLSTDTVEALICSQSWLQTSQRKLSVREAAGEVWAYEEIREGTIFAIEENCRLMCVKVTNNSVSFLYRVCFEGLH
jgi:hypothetical protein